ncbi:MAG: DUF922 domain-containing protein [Methylococcales bacterium]|nr:DUF922 domain-containing protein [Methylococcales bacterium]MDD5631439.1 DUF922 domain-containing protein [Methylococcales bacterium]
MSATSPTLSGWPRQIVWREFRDLGSRPSGISEDAQVAVELRPSRISVERENGQFKLGNVTFSMGVNRQDSWVVADQKSTALLAHEQGHYDIVGLCYRDLIAELQRLRASSQNQLAREVRRIMGQYDQLADTLSDEYDSSQETDHGRNSSRQQAWEKQIQNCMQSGRRIAAPP